MVGRCSESRGRRHEIGRLAEGARDVHHVTSPGQWRHNLGDHRHGRVLEGADRRHGTVSSSAAGQQMKRKRCPAWVPDDAQRCSRPPERRKRRTTARTAQRIGITPPLNSPRRTRGRRCRRRSPAADVPPSAGTGRVPSVGWPYSAQKSAICGGVKHGDRLPH